MGRTKVLKKPFKLWKTMCRIPGRLHDQSGALGRDLYFDPFFQRAVGGQKWVFSLRLFLWAFKNGFFGPSGPGTIPRDTLNGF